MPIIYAKQLNLITDIKKEPKQWEAFTSDYLHKEPWYTLRRNRVKISNGAIIPDYYILQYPNWINVIAITKDGNFLFIYQYRHGLQQYFYELTAGVCNATNKSSLETAQRELLDEKRKQSCCSSLEIHGYQ